MNNCHSPSPDRCAAQISLPLYTADVNKMYRAVELIPTDCDLVQCQGLLLYDKVTFGVSASSFAANMAVKQNAVDFSPIAAEVVDTSFYVDDC